MKKKVLAAILIAVGVLTGCGNTEPISSPIQTVEAEPIATDIQEVEQPGATEEANGMTNNIFYFIPRNHFCFCSEKVFVFRIIDFCIPSSYY